MNLVFTRASLNSCLQQVRDNSWFVSFAVPDDGSWDVLVHDVEDVRYLIHRNDEHDTARIVILGSREANGLAPLPKAARFQALTRIHRAATAAARPPLWLPADWSVFHENNLVAFFATTREYGNLRWIMEQLSGARHDVSFWELTTEERAILLQHYRPDHNQLTPALSNWGTAIDAIKARFTALPAPLPEALADRIDLGEISYAAVTQHRTYSEWLGQLSHAQASFVNDKSRSSIKVRGPAGSGKTLALELKLLHELYTAQSADRDIRILFATHSWAVAIQVDEALRSLDETGDLSGVEVMPLLAIAQMTLPRERTITGLHLLGEDSLSGKQEQLDYITELLDEMRTSDWLAFRANASQQFRDRVESTNRAEVKALVWDLMNEFASVLSANGILPGINAERKYAAVARSAWMMPLVPGSSDRSFVLHVYDKYVSRLKAGSAMSSDQLINDFWNYLETFAWNIRREKDGYDIIFVDELHLFSQQERLTLNLLTRNPDQYPRMYMALDPRQSPSEIYAGFDRAKNRADSGEADLELGTYQSMDLKQIYRFTPQILDLLRHINRSYPAFENVGEDWVLDLESVQSSVTDGPKPTLFQYLDLRNEMAAVAQQAHDASSSADGRVAVVLLDPLLLKNYDDAFRATGIPTVLIASRDEVEQLRYTKRGVILSAAEYVAGLQFNTVLVAGFVDSSVGIAHSGYQRRRLYSLLYLALSRATFRVVINVNDSIGGIPDVLESAFAADILVLQK